jgi:outer membrane protein TolC
MVIDRCDKNIKSRRFGMKWLVLCAALFVAGAGAALAQHALPVQHALPAQQMLLAQQMLPVQQTYAGSSLRLTLEEVISTAREQSVPALRAKHQFVVSYWRYRTYKAQFLPSLNLSANLGQYNRSLVGVQNSETGKINYVENNNLTNSLNLSIDQAIPSTGGSVSVYTSLSRLDQFSPIDNTTYNSQPINIYYNLPIKAFNSLKWEKKIAPKEFELAKKTYQNYVNNEKQPGATSGDCVNCGYCEKKCPQHLKVRQLLKMVEEKLSAL